MGKARSKVVFVADRQPEDRAHGDANRFSIIRIIRGMINYKCLDPKSGRVTRYKADVLRIIDGIERNQKG